MNTNTHTHANQHTCECYWLAVIVADLPLLMHSGVICLVCNVNLSSLGSVQVIRNKLMYCHQTPKIHQTIINLLLLLTIFP